MTDRGAEPGSVAAGGPVRHVPVLREESVKALGVKSGGVYLDGTFGAGGYTRAILAASPDARVIAIDRDPDAIRDGASLVAEAQGRLILVKGRFGDLDEIAREHGFDAIDGVALDVGVSSMQFDEAQRGFSFRHDAPLDMRMESQGRSAADILAEDDEAQIADILYHYGEERRSRAIARAIVARRNSSPVTTTKQLADLIATIERPRPNMIHPATRSFQALRIAVNDELGELARALHAAERILKPGGKLAIVSFHSLEDRIVKQFLSVRSGRGESASRRLPGEPLAETPTFMLTTRKPIEPSDSEIAANPRARSARLRAAERTDAAARGEDSDIMALAALPQRGETRRA
ncbi:16S rRNA (cytosine(1402)-N(4))-methyltransferase RsmH [Terrarubrum flagellatum]|uniref:16S rRNA (cytosine(1402)-N(4))-methyltransferase RsmH n=1 Tax=Terrirubrum flagellatum TaxID=2895980 RepID=UPI0031453309